MRKVIYYYSEKFPEYPIEEIPIKDISYYITMSGTKWLSTIYTTYNIATGQLDEDLDYWHSIQLYPTNDRRVFTYESGLAHYLFSTDARLLESRRQQDIKYQLKRLKERVEKLEDARRK